MSKFTILHYVTTTTTTNLAILIVQTGMKKYVATVTPRGLEICGSDSV